MPDLLLSSVSGTDVRIWGRNGAIGSGSIEDLTSYNQATNWYTILTASGSALDVSSSSTSDTAAGTGARKVRIVGLDANGKIQTEVVTLNGQSIVTTSSVWTDVFGADVTETGSGGQNAGDIHMVKTSTGGSYTGGVPGTLTSAICKILLGWNTEMLGHYKVPAGAGTYQLIDLCASSYSQAAALQVLIQEPDSSTDKSTHTACVFGLGSSGFMQADMRPASLTISAGQALLLRGIGAAASAIVQASFLLRKIA